MNAKSVILVCGMWAAATVAWAQYAPAGDRIKTSWAEDMDVNRVWAEYPRPIMERTDWSNLNGLWSYAIEPKSAAMPRQYDGEILVPFAVESSLSGVGKSLGEEQVLWYKREFTVPSKWKGRHVLLHFGAVDWQADVWVNDMKVGMHKGGYTPFSFDITPALKKSGANTLVVRVYDPTDAGYQPRGKQVNRPEGIWYTPVSGIWQTVWLEPVAETHIDNLRILPDIDRNILSVGVETSSESPAIVAEVVVFDGDREVARGRSVNNQAVEVAMPEQVKLWSPDAPNLYDLQVRILRDGKVVDQVSSYAAMRKYSMRRDDKGIVRFQLNNRDIFHFGPLDQGWWPDGLYTAPSYEAMIYDVKKTKDWGFNMIRKHVKVEPALWYTYCDRIGMIVWQDMPSSEKCCEWQNRNYFEGTEFDRSAESEANYRREWKEIMDYLYSYPCISTWVPFNEAWGQFKTVEITEWTQQYDPSRLVNSASGGNFFMCGDILDLHHYPGPSMYLFDAHRANVLGEYGGIGYPMEGHLWAPDRNWGYIQFKSSKEVTDQYVEYAEQLLDLIERGFTGAVYTQTTDVEIEVNGIMTYDRKVVKMDEDRIREINSRICHSLDKPVDLASLLDEMVDRDALASYPDPSYVTRQFSSYDRASVRPDTSSWYANWDRTQFIRTDSIEGRREFVVFDAEGPGAITRFWVTVADYSGKGVLRFYIDGSATPQIEGEPLSILSGHKLVGAPLSTSVAEATDYLQRGHNLYLPIPYAKSCKITYESPSVKEPGEFSGECFYYNINYRTYERGTRVVSFSMDELEKNRARIELVQKQLVESGRPDSLLQRESLTRTLAPGDSATLRLTGTRAIRELRCALAAADYNQALRSTVLQMRFDGHTTVWVPLGDFMGTGNRLTPYKSFYTEVRADSTLSCYWTMPFKESCEVTVRNLGQEPVGLDLSLYSGDWKWTRRSMYFGAGWTEYNHLYTGALRDMKGTDSQFDINWVELSGRGVYVGDAVTLFNTVADWWGEGDEKIYVDGESFPSHFGTGTEDYYGYAWCMHNPFDHPFIAEPDGTGSTQCGHVSNVRYRALDAIPFERSLKFDMEVWHWCSTWINYAPVTYYYLCAGGTSNRGAEAEMAARKIATRKNDLVPNYPDDNGVIEGEFLDITLTGGVEKSQTILPMQWSNNAQFFWLGAKPGDKATLTFSVDRAGEAQLSAVMTVAPDYGCFDLWLNGRLIRSGLDAYAVALGKQTVDLGKHRLQAGDNTLQVVQRGKNSRASNTCFGLDCLIVK